MTMKNISLNAALAAVTLSGAAHGAEAFTNFIRQVQVNNGAQQQLDVESMGSEFSPLAIDPGGAKFELWTVRDSDFESFLLDQVYVSTYTPVVRLNIISLDPYETVPRTRADQPFTMTLELSELSDAADASDAARMVKLQHYLQSYGEDGDGSGIDPATASLTEERYLDQEKLYSFGYELPTITVAAASTKARGEERFTVWSLPDFQAPELVIATKRVQVWPVADGVISGIEDGDALGFLTPQVTITLNDLYPDSSTYAQVYKGPLADGVEGREIIGSAIVVNDAVPLDKVLVLDDWDSPIDESGQWTMEVLTKTPFGTDRLDSVTFTIHRDIEVNANVTTVESSR